MANVLANLATGAMTVTAVVLTVIAFRAWRFSGNPKVGLIAAAFALLFLKGLVLSIDLFGLTLAKAELFTWSVLFDLAVLIMFYLAILRPSSR